MISKYVRDITCMCFTFAAAPPRGRGVRADEIRAYPTVIIMHTRAWSIGKLTMMLNDVALGRIGPHVNQID